LKRKTRSQNGNGPERKMKEQAQLVFGARKKKTAQRKMKSHTTREREAKSSEETEKKFSKKPPFTQRKKKKIHPRIGRMVSKKIF